MAIKTPAFPNTNLLNVLGSRNDTSPVRLIGSGKKLILKVLALLRIRAQLSSPPDLHAVLGDENAGCDGSPDLCWAVSVGAKRIKALTIVKPDTVIRWHHAGFRSYWRWKSRHRCGRPIAPLEIRRLIREMSIANPLWGAPESMENCSSSAS